MELRKRKKVDYVCLNEGKSSNELDDKTTPRTKSKRVTSTLGTKMQTKKTVDDYKKKQQRKLELKMMEDLSAIAQRCLKDVLKGGRNEPTITTKRQQISNEQYMFLRKKFSIS
ncbi:unnamed protein product [Didymodactylos carnosus]|uniref:Uncharacterized protein n=1 Tax=Didymodactylos carnosus TaxID=1234261 RepID=A0A8S2IAD9_9BILA|nr:unnamed protein product [Didymodactylos carnosus]CAF3735144.1 unnamed protein product [Didymodactylos carnosus]